MGFRGASMFTNNFQRTTFNMPKELLYYSSFMLQVKHMAHTWPMMTQILQNKGVQTKSPTAP